MIMQLKNNDKEISDNFWALKGIAILSVICAHVGTIMLDNLFVKYCSNILNNIGIIGVGIFYFISGYYYKFNQTQKLHFLMTKMKTLIIPWLIAATIIWLYVILRKGEIAFDSWFNFLIGNGSIFYFMTNLIIYFIIFAVLSYLKNKKAYIYMQSLIFITFLSEIFLILESNNISLFLTPYLNFMLFIGYFSLGQYFQNFNKKEITLNSNRILLIFIILVAIFVPVRLSYWYNFIIIPLELGVIISLYCLCTVMDKKLKTLLISLGKDSFAIFLWHIPIAGIIVNLTNRVDFLQYFVLIRPIIVCFIIWMGIVFLKRILKNKIMFAKCIGLNYKT